MTVVEFKRKDKDLEELFEYVDRLQELYDALNKCHESINELEIRAAEAEAMYDRNLEKFIKKVGVENCPTQLLDYSMKSMEYFYEWYEKDK